MASIFDSVRLHVKYVGISVRGQLQYRASFIMASLGHLITTGAEIFGIWALFAWTGNLKGWQLFEVGLFYGIVNVAFALADGLARPFDTFSLLVKTGDFDILLLRPRSTVLQVMGQEWQLMRVGRLAQGLLVLIWALVNVKHASPYNMIIVAFAVLGGACLFYGLFVLQATMAFWSTETLELMNILTYGGTETAQYPLPIFRRWFQRFFIFIVPIGCVTYLPGIAILRKPDTILGTPLWLQCFSPCLGVAFLIASLYIWQLGVRHYRSTGS